MSNNGITHSHKNKHTPCNFHGSTRSIDDLFIRNIFPREVGEIDCDRIAGEVAYKCKGIIKTSELSIVSRYVKQCIITNDYLQIHLDIN